MLRRQPGKRPSGDLAQRIAKALGLPADYFPEARLARVIEQVSRDGNLRDQLYDRLKRRR
jgi:hypothetical protein